MALTMKELVKKNVPPAIAEKAVYKPHALTRAEIEQIERCLGRRI